MDTLVLLSREPVKFSREHGGYTLKYHLADPRFDGAFNLILQSSEEQDKRIIPKHCVARQLAGKQLRVTIEVIEETR